jgi:hypothetical protein
MRLLALLTSVSLSVTISLGACATSGADDPDCVGGKCDGLDDDSVSLCAAVRGNGDRIPAHFTSLARIVEHYGTLDAIAGGSSASVTGFLYESIATGRTATSCGEASCDERAQADRTALMLKSLQGYMQVVAASPEVAAVTQLAPLVARIRASGIAELAETDVVAARDALVTLLESDDVRALVNPDLIALLQSSPALEFHLQDTMASIAGTGSFDASDPRIFVRPGLIHWPALVEMVGRVGSFYAGVGPADVAGMDAWAEACAAPGRGKDWPEVAALPMGETTCGARFVDLLSTYRAARDADPSAPNRVDDEVGERLPVLAITSVIEGASADAMREALATYAAGAIPTIDVGFEDVRYGYAGQPGDLERLAANAGGYDDLKTAKLETLGAMTWRQILALSPAEPGLSPVRELGDGRLSAGGWADLHPVQALENLGCDEVVYVTREGGDSKFAEGVARQLGMSDAARGALYDLGRDDSSFSVALEQADAVWCTAWDAGSGDPFELSSAAWSAPMESSNAFFVDGDDAYPGVASELGKPGC